MFVSNVKKILVVELEVSTITSRKICGCYMVCFLDQTPIFDWYAIW